MREMKKRLFMISLGLLLAFMFVLFMGCGNEKEVPPEVDEEPEEQEEIEEEEVDEDENITLKKLQPICVVINNHSAARPQSGLQEASVVYEFLVEGGITRFLAVFDELHEEDYIIGPIRSLRPYFAHQVMEHGGIVAHAGYSSRTREMISGLNLKHITSASYLWRDSSRKAPHNLYTHIEKLQRGAGIDMDATEEEIILEELPEGYEEGLEIEVAYSPSNRVTYTYQQESGTYLRLVNGNPSTDRESGDQYYADRVIIRETRHENVSGSSLVNVNLEGEGNGYLYENGRKYSIKWEKKAGEKTDYYFKDGTPVEMRWGTTWLQVVPLNS